MLLKGQHHMHEETIPIWTDLNVIHEVLLF